MADQKNFVKDFKTILQENQAGVCGPRFSQQGVKLAQNNAFVAIYLLDVYSLAVHAHSFCAEVKSLEVPSLHSACFLFSVFLHSFWACCVPV